MSKSINCIIIDDASMAREILEIHLNKIELINIIGSYKNVTEAFNAISTQDVDLIFSDINMLEISELSFDIIQSFTNEFIEVNSKPIPISRSYKKEVLRRLENV
jgi:DNA-binding LytR/AlgR family response regulator